LRFLDFFGRWALGFFTGPSEEGGLEELEESLVNKAIFRSNSSIRALKLRSVSTITCGSLWAIAMASSRVIGEAQT
jgi:hypothetical protein